MTILTGDCRDLMPGRGPFDMILADPPYGDTSLAWDRRVAGWIALARAALTPTGSLWVFGSLRHFMATADQFADAGLQIAQEIVWEKQNGSSFHADRFKRVHELAVQFYPAETPWRDIYNDVQTTLDATARTVRRKMRPPHTGHIDAGHHVSHDGGPRLMRSVIYLRNCHGRAIHPTEKPSALLEILIRTSCPEGGLVGDWFAGSGAAGEACRLSGRRYLGCEIDTDMAEKARARIASVLPFDGKGRAMSERPTRKGFASRPANPEHWIKAADAPPRNDGTGGFTARLTIDVTPELRGRIKITAFSRGVTVADMLRDLLAREFPPTEGDPS